MSCVQNPKDLEIFSKDILPIHVQRSLGCDKQTSARKTSKNLRSNTCRPRVGPSQTFLTLKRRCSHSCDSGQITKKASSRC